MPLKGADIRTVLLTVVAEAQAAGAGSPLPSSLQQVSLLGEARQRLGRLTPEEEQGLLTAWYDLFRTGHLSWGYNLNNPNPPFCHVTEQGRRTLAHVSRDPSNHDGYVAHLNNVATINPVAASYVDEALRTYNANCYRAAAVMIGAAAESVALEVRDEIVAGLTRTKQAIPKDFSSLTIKRVLNALQREIESRQASMLYELFEAFQSHWPAFTQEIRTARNDAGHPARIDPVTEETVHAAMAQDTAVDVKQALASARVDMSSWRRSSRYRLAPDGESPSAMTVINRIHLASVNISLPKLMPSASIRSLRSMRPVTRRL
jgi:hypothetical protein